MLTSSATAAIWMTLKALRGQGRATRCSCPRTPRSPPSRRSASRARRRSSWTWTTPTRSTSRTPPRRCRPRTVGLRAGAPLRPSRRPRRRPAPVRGAQPLAARGLRAGARGRLAGAQGRHLRPRGRVLVLPVQEPDRDGRRRACSSPTTTTSPRAAGDSATTAASTRTCMPRSASTCASTTSRPRSAACSCGRLDAMNDHRRSLAARYAARARGPAARACPREPPGRATSITSTWCARRERRRARQVPQGARHRNRHPLPGREPPAAGGGAA